MEAILSVLSGGAEFGRDRFEDPLVVRRERREETVPATEWPEEGDPHLKEERRHRVAISLKSSNRQL